jgi:hypothetical protein
MRIPGSQTLVPAILREGFLFQKKLSPKIAGRNSLAKKIIPFKNFFPKIPSRKIAGGISLAKKIMSPSKMSSPKLLPAILREQF